MDAAQRDALAERLFERLHPFMAWLAFLFVIVVLGDGFVRDESPFDTIFTVATWLIWAAFAAEYAARFAIAPARGRFVVRTWWQILLLVLPFLGLIRILAALRIARAGRVVSAAVRTSRSAGAALSNRILWLAAITLTVILLATNLFYEFAGVRPYATALHDIALLTITGEPLRHESAIAQILDVALALYAVVVFASLAGTLGAFFLERRGVTKSAVN